MGEVSDENKSSGRPEGRFGQDITFLTPTQNDFLQELRKLNKYIGTVITSLCSQQDILQNCLNNIEGGSADDYQVQNRILPTIASNDRHLLVTQANDNLQPDMSGSRRKQRTQSFKSGLINDDKCLSEGSDGRNGTDSDYGGNKSGSSGRPDFDDWWKSTQQKDAYPPETRSHNNSDFPEVRGLEMQQQKTRSFRDTPEYTSRNGGKVRELEKFVEAGVADAHRELEAQDTMKPFDELTSEFAVAKQGTSIVNSPMVKTISVARAPMPKYPLPEEGKQDSPDADAKPNISIVEKELFVEEDDNDKDRERARRNFEKKKSEQVSQREHALRTIRSYECITNSELQEVMRKQREAGEKAKEEERIKLNEKKRLENERLMLLEKEVSVHGIASFDRRLTRC